MARRLRILAVSVAALWGCAAFAQANLGWWGQYHLQGDYLKTSYQTDWLLEQNLDATVAGFVLDPRLGTWELNAGLLLLTGEQNGKSGTAAALGRYGAALHLFPYRKFPLSLYYSKDFRPAIFGYPKAESTRMGFQLGLLSRRFGTSTLSYDTVDYSYGGREETRSLARFKQNRRFGRLTEELSYEDHEFTYPAYTFRMKLGQLGLRYDLKEGSYLQSQTQFQEDSSQDRSSRLWSEELNWIQNFRQDWTMIARVGAREGSSTYQDLSALGASATLQWLPESWAVFGGAAYDTLDVTVPAGTGASLTTSQVFGGATRYFGPRLQVTADLAVGQERREPAILYGEDGTLLTAHAGISSGNGLPQWASSLAYRYRTISFERRMSEWFPPGYASPEVQMLRNDYYIRTHSGSSGVAADLYHQEAAGWKVDALVASGSLRLNHTLALRSRLDLRKESSRGGGSDLAALWLGADYNSPKGYSLGGSLNFSKASSRFEPAAVPAAPGGTVDWDEIGIGLYFSRTFGIFPVSAQVQYTTNSLGYDTLFLHAETSMQLRDLRFRVIYQYSRTGSGPYSHRFYIDLLRLFRGNAY